MKQRARRKVLGMLSADESLIRRIAHDVMARIFRAVMDRHYQRLMEEQKRLGLR